MKSINLAGILTIVVFNSCLYKAGERQSDLNISIPVSINSYYVDEFLRAKWMKPIYEYPLNSELINYPKDFVPLTDSINKLKYVIELRVSGDSLHNNGFGLILSSIYSFEKSVGLLIGIVYKIMSLLSLKIFLRIAFY